MYIFNIIQLRWWDGSTNTGAWHISSRNNYHCYYNINNGFTIEAREQYHICDLMGRGSSCRGPLERSCASNRWIFSTIVQIAWTILTMRRYFLKNSDRWRKKNQIGKTERKIFSWTLECSEWSLSIIALATSSYWRRKALRPPYSKVKLHFFRHYESSKAVYSI